MTTEEAPPTTVDLRADDAQALWRLTSTSSTVYYLDMRPDTPRAPLLMRARGDGTTATGLHDNEWVRLALVLSGPRLEADGQDLPDDQIDVDDQQTWVLRVGSRHRFDYRVPGGYLDTTDFWWVQRPLTGIERLDEMPADDALTVPETDDPRYRRDSAPDYR